MSHNTFRSFLHFAPLRTNAQALLVGVSLALVATLSACPEEPAAASSRVMEITEQLRPGEGWSALSAADQAELQSIATKTLAGFRAEWGAAGLAAKEATLVAAISDSAHPATIAFNAAFRARFRSRLETPDTFEATTGLSSDLLPHLVRLHLVHLGARRINAVRYNGIANVDWDGSGPITSNPFPLPDEQAMADQRAYALAIEESLLKVDRGPLSAEGLRILDRGILYARQLATGSTGFRFGGRDFETPWGVAQWSWDLMCNMSEACLGKAFATDAAFLEAVNAWFFGPLRFVDEGAIAALDDLLAPSEDTTEIEAFLGDLDTTPVARSYAALVAMWRQRTRALPAASAPCALRTDEERTAAWRSFSSENLLYPVLTGSLTELSSQVEAFQTLLRDRQKGHVQAIVDAMVAAGETSTTVAQGVQAALDGADVKGLAYLLNVGYSALASADAGAALLYKTRLETLPTVGGDANAAAKLQSMWDEVRSWLLNRYFAGVGVDASGQPLLPEDLDLKEFGGAFTSAEGRISLGTSGTYPAPQYYKTMIHEAHHSLAYGVGGFPEGASWEGAAVVAEFDLLTLFLSELWTDNPEERLRIPYYMAAVWVGNQFVAAGSEVSLGNYTRTSCEPAALDYLAETATLWGLSESLFDGLADRVFAGLNYLQYAAEAIAYREAMEALDARLGPETQLDPYILLGCGIGDPVDDDSTESVLRACLGLP